MTMEDFLALPPHRRQALCTVPPKRKRRRQVRDDGDDRPAGLVLIPGDLPLEGADSSTSSTSSLEHDEFEDVPGERLPLFFTNSFPVATGPPAPATVWCAYCGQDVPRSPRGGCVDCEAIGPRRLPRNPPPLPPATLKPIPESERTLFERIAFPDPIIDED